ncbi:MAG: conserved membrane protein of unknown function [Candidatus Thorarchaeota archaeon]|nr:MAG: conserved membrane protein of unknown function [Candidatus Thorarchaeota archaeon]
MQRVGNKRWIKPAIILIIAILSTPYALLESAGLGSSNLHIRAPFWEYVQSFYFSGFQLLDLTSVISGLPFLILRLFSLVVVIAYFQGRISKNITLLLSSIIELGPLVVTAMGILEMVNSPAYIVMWPLPILLGIILILIQTISVNEPTSPF